MKVLELQSISKEDGYIYYIHHYKATAIVEFLTKKLEIPVSFTVEMNPLGLRTVDLDPLPKDIDYPIVPITKALKEFIDVLASAGSLPQT